MRRFVIEMGQGVDLHGSDMTKAARRGVEDALRHASFPLFPALGIDRAAMRVRVTVAVPDPDAVDVAAVAALLPYGDVAVEAVAGGLSSTNPDDGEVTTVAAVAVEAFLPEALARGAVAERA
ncbi:Lin0512 family protein [Jannaschia sp. Os4]|uniref:Lin0512 family protein n=1 Tax=Jannaschia sp. Os4 TaxID=2807617 RepID=UPI00193A5969|nr:Lin0512 family protein [Jannaschia sp. Os4]MBM2574704.1 Lin0512 family protein [Jannaschia sp. Os4]